MATLTTSPQVIGENSGTQHTRLYAWYDGQSGNSCTVHFRLTVVYEGITYTGTNKKRQLAYDGYNSGTIDYGDAPLYANQEYTVMEGSRSYSGGETVNASALYWSYVYGSSDIGNSQATVPTFYTNPSTPSVTLKSKTHNSATFGVSISSYGNPSSENGRYIEAAILGTSNYGSNPRRWQPSYRVTSADITVNNSSSTGSPALTIQGNTKYWYGGYATNTQRTKQVVTGSFYTPCPPLSALSLSSQTYATYNTVDAVISYTRQSDGGAETRTGYYRYSIDGGSTWSAWMSFGTVSNTTGTFIANLPTSESITLQARLSTPNGGNSEIKSATFQTSTTHTAPNFSDFAYEDASVTAVAVSGNNQIFIQGQSQPKVIISAANKATANDDASISGYTASLNAASIQIPYSSAAEVSGTFAAGSPTAYGTLALTVAANDSLSLATAVSKNVAVIPWAAPTLAATATRVNNFYAQTTLAISGTYSPVSVNGVVKNTLAVAYRYKKSNSSTWEQPSGADENGWVNRPITITDSSYQATDLILSFDNEYQWDIEVRAVDAFATTVVALTLSVGKPIFFIGQNGKCSINRKPTNSAADLDIEGLIYSQDQPVMVSHVGMVIMSTTLTTAAEVRDIYGGYWTTFNTGISGVNGFRRTS